MEVHGLPTKIVTNTNNKHTNTSEGSINGFNNNNCSVAGAPTGPRSKCDQVMFEAICKACEVIVGSRTLTTSTSSNSGGNCPNQYCTINSNNPNMKTYVRKNSQNTSTATSTRFNLQVPEVPGVRQILSNFRLQLHVPIRLDVYYQHPDNENIRELLERWCLEYRPCSSSEKFLEAEGLLTTQKQDAMSQLRHVCKRIVIWLRTLYVYSRFLPSHCLRQEHHLNEVRSSGFNNKINNIGFSLYVNQDGADDVNFLIQKHGFLRQLTPSGPITTPYGQLNVSVVYLSFKSMKHLLPQPATEGMGVSMDNELHQQQSQYKSKSRPIPMQNRITELHPPNTHGFPEHNTYNRNLTAEGETISCRRASSYSERNEQFLHQLDAQKTNLGTFDPSTLIPPRKRDSNLPSQNKVSIQRRHTSIGAGGPLQSDSHEPPQRVMSGLSLALMMATGEDVSAPSFPPMENNESDAFDVITNKTDEGLMNDNHVKRRAVLHQMPPHLVEQQQSDVHASHKHQHTSSSGEYGYAYNNHIPWQKMHKQVAPAIIHTTMAVRSNLGDSRSASPSPFSTQHYPSTPPTAAFLLGPSATTPVNMVLNGSNAGASPLPTALIPPVDVRSRSNSAGNTRGEALFSLVHGGITPPFQNRPIGFIQEASIATTTPAPGFTDSERLFDKDYHNEQYIREQFVLQNQQQLASLDLLHSNPFQLQHHQHSSLMSALSFNNNSSGTTGGFDSVLVDYSNPGWKSSALSSFYVPRSAAAVHLSENDSLFYEDTMPFAVDMSTSTTIQQQQTSTRGDQDVTSSDSSFLGQSTALATLAQKCSASNNRLKLFQNVRNEQNFVSVPSDIRETEAGVTQEYDDLVLSLADQLEHFRSFGASVLLQTTTSNVGVYDVPKPS